MDDARGAVLWALRMGLTTGGGWLASRGYGDAGLWDALGGAVLAAIGAVWSWRARKAALAAEPPR